MKERMEEESETQKEIRAVTKPVSSKRRARHRCCWHQEAKGTPHSALPLSSIIRFTIFTIAQRNFWQAVVSSLRSSKKGLCRTPTGLFFVSTMVLVLAMRFICLILPTPSVPSCMTGNLGMLFLPILKECW